MKRLARRLIFRFSFWMEDFADKLKYWAGSLSEWAVQQEIDDEE